MTESTRSEEGRGQESESEELEGRSLALRETLDMEGDEAGVIEGLRRAAGVVTGDLRVDVLLEWSRRVADDQELVRELLTDALAEGRASTERLEVIHRCADEAGVEEVAVRALRDLVDCSTDPLARAERLERLAAYLSQRGDLQGAVDVWVEALDLHCAAGLDSARRNELYQRIIEVDPSRTEVARAWVLASIDGGDFQAATVPFEALAQHQAQRAAELVLELKDEALRVGAAEKYASWIDELVFTEDVAPETSAELLRAKAEAYDRVGRRPAAGDAYRTLIETTGAEDDAARFEGVLEGWPLDDETMEHLRWLYEWRVERASRPAEELLLWARTEAERFGDADAALTLAERVLEIEPDHRDALSYIADLRLARGATEGAVEALEALLRAGGERDARLALRIAHLYLDELGQTDDAARIVRCALEADPSLPDAAELALRLLDSAGSPALVDALARAATALSDPRAVLRALLELSARESPHAPEREGWFDRLIEVSTEPREKLDYSCQAVAELEYSPARLERARSWVAATEHPEPLLSAYAGAIARAPDTATVTQLGRELLEFFDEWFGDPRPLVEPLLVVLERVPNARWALERVGLALNLEQRHDAFIDLLERAIGSEEDVDAKAALLDEAAVIAKDLARDPVRALAFLEELLQLRPGDPKTQSQLERLYEQEGEIPKLIELLEDRLQGLGGDAWFELQTRIAKLWLELGDAAAAANRAEELLSREPESSEAVGILERALDVCRSGAGVGGSDPAEVLWTIASRLAHRYEHLHGHGEAARVLETALASDLEDEQRAAALMELARLQRDCLKDPRATFDALARLLLLDPERSESVAELAELALALEAMGEYSRILDEAAFVARTEERRAELHFEAARTLTEHCPDPSRERELYQRVLDSPAEPDLRLRAALELDRIYRGRPEPSAHAPLLVAIADLADLVGSSSDASSPREARSELEGVALATDALGRAAALYHTVLGEPSAAETCWRRRLELDPDDGEALDGLIAVLEHLGDRASWVEALLQRARRSEAPRARLDLGRVARLYVELGDTSSAIRTWQDVRERFGPDADSSVALLALLEREERWAELCEALRDEAGRAHGTERWALCVRLGRVERDRIGDLGGALRSFAEGESWRECRELVRAAAPEVERELAVSLAELATDAWQRGAGDPAEEASVWATERWVGLDLAASAGSGEEHGAAADTLGVLDRLWTLPSGAPRRRRLLHLRARVLAEKLDRPDEAREAYRDLFLGDGADAVARRAFDAWAALLQQHPRDLAHAHHDHGVALMAQDPAGAARHLLEAARLFREQLDEPAAADASLRRAAQLNDSNALRQLVEGHVAARRLPDAIRALDRLASAGDAETSIEARQRQAELYVEVGELERAVAALEQVCAVAPSERRLHVLVELYERLRLDERRAATLAKLAQLCADAAEGRRHRLQAARLHRRAGQPERALELLSLDATDAAESIEYASASSALGRHDVAEAHLTARIAAHGTRRTKPRARLHRALAHLYRTTDRLPEALEELASASSIDPANAQLAFEFAELALERGELGGAERALQSLLLLPRSEHGRGAVARADVYLALSEIAGQRGDAVRARDLVESACECAFEGRDEAERLVRALRSGGRGELVRRALERMWERGSGAAESVWAVYCVARHFECAELDPELVTELEVRMDQLESAPGAPTQSFWWHVQTVEDWLGRTERAERARVALAEGTRDDLGVTELLEGAQHLAGMRSLGGADRARLALTLLDQAREVGRDPVSERAVLEAIVRSEPSCRAAWLALAALQRLPGDEEAHLATLTALAQSDVSAAEDVQAALLAAAEGERWEVATELLQRLPLVIVGEPAEQLEVLLAAATVAENAGMRAAAAALLQRAAPCATEGERASLLRRSCELARSAGERELELTGRTTLLDLERRESEHPLRVAELLGELGRHDELAALLQEIEPGAVQPRDRARLEVVMVRARLASGTEDGEALSRLRRLVIDDPSLAEATELLASELAKRGRLEELLHALLDLEATAREQGDQLRARAATQRLASVLVALGRGEEALERYQALLREGAERELLLETIALHERLGGDVLERAELLGRLLSRESGREAVQRAIQLAEIWDVAERPERARQALVLGLERAPESRELWERAIAKSVALGDEDGALELLDAPAAQHLDGELRRSKRIELLEARGRWPEVIALVGEMNLEDSGHAERARTLLERARPHLPEEELRGAALRIGRSLAAAGRAPEAYATLAGLGTGGEGPGAETDTELLRELVTLAFRTGDEEKVLEALGELVDADPDPRPEDVRRLWQAARSLRKEGRARLALERALERHPRSRDLQEAMTTLLEVSGDHRALAEHLMRGVSAEERGGERARVLRRVAELERGFAPELAMAHAAEAQELEPTFEGSLELAVCQAACGRIDQAQTLLTELAAAKPGREPAQRARAHHELAKLHLAAYDLVEAHEAQTLAFKLDMKNAEMALPYALLALDLDDEVGARKALRALTSMKLGEVDGRDTVTKTSRSQAFFHLGALALRRGDKTGARRMAARAVEEHADNESARALLQATA